MPTKMVMTEKGLLLSKDLVISSDEVPQFLEEARAKKTEQPQPQSQPRLSKQLSSSHQQMLHQQSLLTESMTLSNLYANSNGYLDRVTLKSAQSERRKYLPKKPFFLPDYSVGDIVATQRHKEIPKYPGIYPPLSATASSFRISQQHLLGGRKNNSNNIFLQPSSSSTTLNSRAFGSSSTNFKLSPQSPPSPPLVLEFDSQTNKLQGVSSIEKRRRMNKNDNNHNEIVSSKSLTATLGNRPSAEDSPLTVTRGTLTRFSSAHTSPTQMNSLRARMEVKKAQYMQESQLQEAKIKRIAASRLNLSKEPVHIAAAYLQSLKQEDSVVDSLFFEVNFFKTRYKERLSEYHSHKYANNWNKLALPDKRVKQSTYHANSYSEEEQQQQLQQQQNSDTEDALEHLQLSKKQSKKTQFTISPADTSRQNLL